jgi:arylsulfatase
MGLYADVVGEVDEGVGKILDTIDKLGLEENTLVIFTSDNGPWLSYGDHAGQTGIYREGKGTTFEGGVRVPFVARWTGTIPAGAVSNEPLMTIDILPTISEWIDAPLPSHQVDGKSATALLEGKNGAKSPQKAYYFYYKKNDLEAIRYGEWKLHFPHGYRSMVDNPVGSGGVPGKYDYSVKTDLELYSLHQDPSETKNVAGEYPEVMNNLKRLANHMRADLGDSLTPTKPTGQRKSGQVKMKQ